MTTENSAQVVAEGISELVNEFSPFLEPSRFGAFHPERWGRIRELVAEVSAALGGFNGSTSPDFRVGEVRQILPELQRALGDRGAPTDLTVVHALANDLLGAAGIPLSSLTPH